jgi:hypothetical protein
MFHHYDDEDAGRINAFFLKTGCLQNEEVMHMDLLTQCFIWFSLTNVYNSAYVHGLIVYVGGLQNIWREQALSCINIYFNRP